MAALSEEDRKSLMGRDYKPLEGVDERPRRAWVKVLVVAVAIAGAGAYLWSDKLKQLAGKAAPQSVASPVSGTLKK